MSRRTSGIEFIEDCLLVHELFYCRLELGCTILGVKPLADNEVDLVVSSCPCLLESTVCVGDSFLDVEAV